MARHRWSPRALIQLTLVRFREFYREPEALFWSFAFPVIMAGGLGIAFRSRPPEVVTIGLRVDTPAAGGLAQALSRASRMAVAMVDSVEGERLLRRGKISLLVVPLESGDLKLRYDETRYDALVARAIANDRLQRLAGRVDAIRVKDELIKESGARYIDFLIPGLIGMSLMANGMWGIGFAIVDARRRNLLKRLISTPMSRAEYLLSFLISRLALLVVEVAFILGFGMLAFKVPLYGSLAAFGTIAVLGALTFGSLGLLTASRVRTSEGAAGLLNMVMLPMWVLSGVFFAATRFPDSMQPFVQILPLTAANDALRAIALDGASLGSQGGELLILLAWFALTFGLALRMFRWK